MYILTVIPISRGIPLSTLTYASPTRIRPGLLIHIPFRTTSLPAIVESCTEASIEKASLKSLPYRVRTMKPQEGSPCLREELLSVVSTLAQWYAGTPGNILASLVPLPVLRARIDTTRKGEEVGEVETPYARSLEEEQFIFQAEDEERIARYKSIVREEFARKRSVLLIFPTREDLDQSTSTLARGIEDFTHIIHGGLGPKTFAKKWKEVLTIDHPILVIGTPHILSLPRSDIGTIIMDRESSSGYKALTRPRIDYRRAGELLARGYGARLILGDTFLRIETLLRGEQGEFQELQKPRFRLLSNAVCDLVDLRGKEQPATGDTALVSPALRSNVARLSSEHARMVILGTRKGYSPMTVCGDCGSVVVCTLCQAPVVLYKREVRGQADNLFLCHRCGEKRSASERCITCDSWRLIALGAGLDHAEDIIRTIAPDARIFRLDRDHVARHKDAQRIAKEFYQTPGAILLGTELLLPYLTEPVEYSAVLSLQSLLTIPDYAVEEKAFRLILRLRSRTRKHLIVQTRDTRPEFYPSALQGNILECYRREITARKNYHYPPFSIMIKLTLSGDTETIERLKAEIQKTYNAFTPVIFPGFIAKIRNTLRMHALIAIPRADWPKPELVRLLRHLPKGVSLEVEPESLI